MVYILLKIDSKQSANEETDCNNARTYIKNLDMDEKRCSKE